MRSIATVLALAAVAGVALAAGTTVTGVVKDSNGKPLAEATVRFAAVDANGRFRGGYRPVTAKTDEKGMFTLETEETGLHRVSVQVIRPDDNFSVNLPAVEVEGEKQKITLHLTKSEITGKVTCKDTGKPPADRMKLNITMYQVEPWSTAGMGFLDEKGCYRLRGFPPGKYRIYVQLEGYRKAQVDLEIKKNKKKKGVDFVLEPLKAGRIEFTVKDESGAPLTGVEFSYASEPGMSSTLMVEENEEVPGEYVCTQLETGTWKVTLHRDDLEYKRIEVKVKEGETTKVSVTMTAK